MTHLKLRFVQRYRDRHGLIRHYFRRRGGRNVPLPGLPGSDEFMIAYQAALEGAPKVEIGAKRTVPGTIAALITTYLRSSEWKGLTPNTHRLRRPIIERFRIAHGSKRVATLQKHNVANMLDGIENRHAKGHWLTAIRALMQSAVPALRNDNPLDGFVAPKKPKTGGYHPWTDEEIARYRAYWPLGTQQRLVMEFALEALSRRCEVVRLGPQHIKDGRIKIARAKGSRDVDIPLTPELAAACEAMPKGHLTFVLTAYGKARSVEGLGRVFADWVTEAGLPKECRMHGLKKGGMRRLAESSATAHEIMAMSGHKTLGMVQLYTEEFDRKGAADRATAKRLSNRGSV